MLKLKPEETVDEMRVVRLVYARFTQMQVPTGALVGLRSDTRAELVYPQFSVFLHVTTCPSSSLLPCVHDSRTMSSSRFVGADSRPTTTFLCCADVVWFSHLSAFPERRFLWPSLLFLTSRVTYRRVNTGSCLDFSVQVEGVYIPT